MIGNKIMADHLRKSSSSIYYNLRSCSTAAAAEAATGSGKPWGRKAVRTVLICFTGGLALSALDDLAIYHGCSSKGLAHATQNQEVVRALGEPIERGPWYNASLAVAHRRHSVSCTFPVSGPNGTGVLQLKAVRQDNAWFSVLRPQAWDILIMDALLHVPGNEEEKQTFRINLLNVPIPPASAECTSCMAQQPTITGGRD